MEVMERPETSEPLARAQILVVDDEPGMRNFLVKTLRPLCRGVDEAANAAEAEQCLARQHYDVMLLDNIMPGTKGLDWLAERQRTGGFTETIMITAYADFHIALEALRAGASDLVLKPFRSNQIVNSLRRSLEVAQLKRENQALRRALAQSDPGSRRTDLIGSSAAISDVRAVLERVAQLKTPVLITGASGTGKEVAARHLHKRSARADAPFVAIHCGAIPTEMIEVELFGHAPGAFPGAQGAREGLLASAQGGTVFLDDMAELSAHAQTALLRVLEDGVIRPVGSERDVQLDLRFVMSSARSLQQAVAEGRFRRDLLYRINVVELDMPPLKLRGADVVDLAELFLSEIAGTMGVPPLEIPPGVRSAMLRYDWPGNIRELRNFVERALIFGRFPAAIGEDHGHDAEIAPLEDVERREILRALELVGGNRTEAARRLGVSRKTIDRKCATWGL